MKFHLAQEDWVYGGIAVGLFLPVAAVCYPLAVRRRHTDSLRDAVPLRCMAMHLAGFCFVTHDWISWHNETSACLVLSFLEFFASTVFYCTIVWKHHRYYVRHVADRSDRRFIALMIAGGVAFFALGLARAVDHLVHCDKCLRLDAGFAGVGAVLLAGGMWLFHRVPRFVGAHLLLNAAIRLEVAVAMLAVLSAVLKQFVRNDATTITLLFLMTLGFNVTFVLFILPAFVSCARGDASSSGGALNEDFLGVDQNDFDPHDGRASALGVPGTNTLRITDHFQGRHERVSLKLIKKMREGKSERTVLSELEKTLTSSHIPAKLIINAKETRTDRTMLHYAAALGYADVVDRMFEYGGGEVEQTPDAKGFTPLHCVAVGPESVGITPPPPPGAGSSRSQPALASDEAMREASAVPAPTTRSEIVRALVKAGGNVNAVAADGRRPLHYATQGLATVAHAASIERASDRVSSADFAVLHALLASGARQEVAMPLMMDSTALLSSVMSGERHDIEWHHVHHFANAAKKTPLMLATELDFAPGVLAMIDHTTCSAASVPTTLVPSSVTAAAWRKGGYSCGECENASILHVALVSNAVSVVSTLLALNQKGPQLRCMASLLRPMLTARTEGSRGMNVFHCCALSGNPAFVTLLLRARMRLGQHDYGDSNASSRQQTPRDAALQATPEPRDGSTARQDRPADSPAVLATPTPGRSPVFSANPPRPMPVDEARLGMLLNSRAWSDMDAAHERTFSATGGIVSTMRKHSGSAHARKEAAVKALRQSGLSSADALVRFTERGSVEEVLRCADAVKKEAIAKLRGHETKLDPARAGADAAIAAALMIVQHKLSKAMPSQGAKSRSVGKGKTAALAAAAASGRQVMWHAIRDMIEAPAYEHGAPFGEHPVAVTPLDLAASRGHIELCRALAAVHHFAVLCTADDGMSRQATNATSEHASPTTAASSTGPGVFGTPPYTPLTGAASDFGDGAGSGNSNSYFMLDSANAADTARLPPHYGPFTLGATSTTKLPTVHRAVSEGIRCAEDAYFSSTTSVQGLTPRSSTATWAAASAS